MKQAIAGIALFNGLKLRSSGITCTAKRNAKGHITVKIKEYPAYMRKIQLLLFLVIFSSAILLDTSDSPETALTSLIIPMSVFLLMLRYMPQLRILNYHGAEHKVVVAYRKNIPMTLEQVRLVPRVTKVCGSMMLVPILIYMLLLSFISALTDNIFINAVSGLLVLFLLIHYFFLRGEKQTYVYLNPLFPFMKKGPYKLKTNPLYRFFDKTGYFLQEHFTTREPSDRELEVAIRCMNELITQNKTAPK